MTMLIALDENKNLIHITDAVRGLACNCTCFECGEIVLARKGEIKEHHFAHASNKDSCAIQPESVLHKYAKQVIIESMGVLLPEVPNLDIEATWWTFDKIIPEFHLGLIRPDLACYIDEEPIFIEIAVTHFIDEDKLKIIKSMNVKTVEIDLSGLLNSDLVIPSNEAKKLILESLEHKTWLFPALPKPCLVDLMGNKNQSVEEKSDSSTDSTQFPTASTWEDYQFTINGIWVHARKFSGGMLSVNCTYNPEIIAMLKQWRNEGGGRYNNKYKSWNYWQPFSETVLERLYQLHSIE
ncbi:MULTISPECIES: competence protein CoiA family protein [Acinetobacter]|uniref:competence protein CoiA family protein n=1 Tax=Acinetobacter TaxID=469 RepID=UPI0014448D82|nr:MULTISPECIES: competence protein CoiA family protein [Acinetobacter]